MVFKGLLKEIEDKFNSLNNSIEEDFVIDEPYYLEVAVDDAKKAMAVAQKDIFLRRALKDGYLNTTNITTYKSRSEEIIEELINIFNSFGIKLVDSNVGELAEASTSAGVPGYLTPNAFGHEAPESAITAFGMKKTGKPNKNTKALKESEYKQMMSSLYDILEEGKYQEIKNDPTISSKKKVNYAIAEVYTKLYEIEQIVSKNVKLKTEMNQDNRMYWKSTREKLLKLSERLNRVSTHLKNLSA